MFQKLIFGTKTHLSEITKYKNAGNSLDKTATNFEQNQKNLSFRTELMILGARHLKRLKS